MLRIATLVVFLLLGCKDGAKSDTQNKTESVTNKDAQKSKTEDTNIVATNTDSMKKLLDLAGYGSPITIVYWPNRHNALLKAAKGLIALAPPNMKPQLEASFAKMPIHSGALEMISALTTSMHIEMSVSDLEELDLDRPIVAGVTRNLGEWLVIAKHLLKGEKPPAAALHTRLVLPSKKSAELVDSLSGVFVRAGFKAPEGADNTFNTHQLSLRLEAKDQVVLFDILQGPGATKIPSDALTDTTKPSHTDSWLWSTNDRSLLIHARFSEFEAAGSYAGALMVTSAVESVEPESAPALAIAGVAEILALTAVTNPQWQLAEAGQFRISKSGEASQLVFQLSQVGEQHFVKHLGKAEVFSSLLEGPFISSAPAYYPEEGITSTSILEFIHQSGIGGQFQLFGPNLLPLMRLLAQEDPVAFDKTLAAMISADLRKVPIGQKGSAFVINTTGALSFPEGDPKPAATKEELCLYSAMFVTRSVLASLNRVEPGDREAILKKGREDREPHLLCAEKSTDFAPQAKLVRELF